MDKVVPPSQRRQLLDVYDDRLEGDFVEELPGIVSWALSMPFAEMRDVLANPVKHAPSLAQTNIDALVSTISTSHGWESAAFTHLIQPHMWVVAQA